MYPRVARGSGGWPITAAAGRERPRADNPNRLMQKVGEFASGHLMQCKREVTITNRV